MEGKVEHCRGVAPVTQIVVQSASNGSMQHMALVEAFILIVSASLIVEQFFFSFRGLNPEPRIYCIVPTTKFIGMSREPNTSCFP